MKRRAVMSLVLMLMLTCVLGVTRSFAASDEYGSVTIAVPSEDGKKLDSLRKGLEDNESNARNLRLEYKTGTDGAQSGNTPPPLAKVTDGGIVFNYGAFEDSTSKSQKRAVKVFVSQLQDSGMSQQTQQNVIDSMSESSNTVSRLMIPLVMDSTSADLYTAMKWIAPVLPFVRIVFGLGAIIIAILLIGSTILDLVFIGFPFAREKMSSKGGEGGKVAWVTTDAQSAIKETESSIDSSGGYKNAYFIYFKRRALTYILLSLCLLYLVVGELGGLIGWILQIGSGVIN